MSTMKNIVHNIDNLEFMKDIPINHYDLAIVDPPYGLDRFNHSVESKKMPNFKNKLCDWDNKPSPEYWHEIWRVAKYLIIWGANNFELPNTEYFIIFDKKQPCKNFARCEYAWTNVKMPSKIFEMVYFGGTRKKYNNIHPTQKPVALYKWLLQNYAKPGYKIFDSHVGSGSIRIACHDMGFEFEGCELDKDYWQAQEERYQNHISQGNLFGTDEIQGLIFNG